MGNCRLRQQPTQRVNGNRTAATLALQRRAVLGQEWGGTSLVFASEAGTALDPTNVNHRFSRTVKAASLRRVRVHDLRHTAATLALQ